MNGCLFCLRSWFGIGFGACLLVFYQRVMDECLVNVEVGIFGIVRNYQNGEEGVWWVGVVFFLVTFVKGQEFRIRVFMIWRIFFFLWVV